MVIASLEYGSTPVLAVWETPNYVEAEAEMQLSGAAYA
jgi:hypothetical protein